MKCTVRGTNGGVAVHIRVNEVYNYAPKRQIWGASARLQEPCLAVATVAQNAQQRPGLPPTVGEHRRKHIGLYTGGLIWHYSTGHRQVFAHTPEYWRRFMNHIYGGNGQFTVVFLSAGLLHV